MSCWVAGLAQGVDRRLELLPQVSVTGAPLEFGPRQDRLAMSDDGGRGGCGFQATQRTQRMDANAVVRVSQQRRQS